MHGNLVRVQQEIVENVKENLKILEVSDKRPVIVSVLACAEGPLTEQDIAARADIGAKEIGKILAVLSDKEVVVRSQERPTGKVVYELNPRMEQIVFRNIKSKTETLGRNTKGHMDECEKLIESATAEFDDYDRLMARYLREKIGRMRLFTTILTKRTAFLNLLDASVGEGGKITKIPVE
jgi:hypothetical protein